MAYQVEYHDVRDMSFEKYLNLRRKDWKLVSHSVILHPADPSFIKAYSVVWETDE
jgi:hypothetical protein